MENQTDTKSTDLFDNLDKLAVDQSFDALTTKVDFVHIPHRKPNKQSFIRVSPDPAHRIQLAMLEVESGVGGDKELFVVLPEVVPGIADLPGLSHRLVVLAVARPENSPFLWPIKLPNESGRSTGNWGHSAMEIARQAKTQWLRVSANLQMGCYVATVATADWPEPKWPELTMSEMLRRSFGESGIIQTVDHPVVRTLRGME